MAVDIETIGVAFETSGLVKGQTALKQTEQAANRTADAADKTGRSFSALDSAARAAAGAMSALAGAFAVRELVQAVDTYTKFTAQLKLATTSAQDYARAYADVRSISKLAQADLGAVGTLYARIANGTRELGLGQQKLAAITETVSLALKVSGAGAAESASAMLQLSQAFASGVLRGEEFNAVNEAAPRLMKALADGIGVGVDALRGMAEQGQLTSQVLAEALPKALGELREEAKSVQTIAGSVQLLKNNWLEFVGTQAQASGAVGAVSQSIALLANNLDTLAAAALGFGAAKLAQVMIEAGAATARAVVSASDYIATQQAQRASAIASAQAEAQKTAATLANLQATQAGIVAAREQYIAELQLINAFKARGLAMQQASAVTAELALLGQQQARVSAQIAATQTAQTAAQTALNTAMTAGGAAAGLASRALGLLGGPIGVITTLLGLGATAWMLWGTKAQESAQKAGDALRDTLADSIAVAQSQLPALNRQIQESLDAGYAADSSRVQALMRRRDALQAEIDSARKQRQQIADQQAKEEAISRNEYARRVDLNKLAAQHAAKGAEYMKRYATDAEKLTAALEEARIAFGGVLPPDAEARIRASFIKPTKDAGNAANDLRRELDAQADILAKLSGVNTDYMEQLSRLNGLWQSGRITQGQYVELVTELIAKQPGAAKAIEATARAREQDAAVALRQLAAYEDLEQAADAQIKYAKDMLAAIEAESAALKMTNAQREEAIALRQLEMQGIKAGTPVYEEFAQKIRYAIAGKAISQAYVDATKKAEDEWQRTSDQIGQSLSDALMEGGKSAWEYIKGLFRSQVLAPIIKAVIAPVTGGLATLATGGASAASGGSALSGLSSLTGLTSLGTFGGGLSAGFGGLMGSLGLSATGTTLGGALSAGWTALGAGNIAGGLGTLAGALGPIALGIGALVSLFGNKNKWSGRFGEASVFGGVASAGGNSAFSNSSYSGEIAKGTSQLAQGISDLARTFGGGGDFVLRQFSATASKKDAAQAGTDLFVGGQFFSTGSTEVKKDQQAQEFANQALRATVLVLQETVQGRFAEYFRSVDALKADIPDLQALLETATAVQQLGKQLQWLGGPFDDLVSLSVQATADMAKAAGGFDQLLSITSNAYQVLYTEEERLAFLREDVAAGFERLGLAMPETTQQLREYIEGLDTSTEAGRALLLELLKLAPALDQVAEKVTDVVGAVLTEAQQQAVRAGYSINPEVAAVQAQQRADDAIREAVRIQREREKQWEAWLGIKDPGRKTPAADGMGLAINLAGAYQAQIDAMTSQRSEIEKSVNAYRALNESLMSFKTSLLLGASSTLTPQQQYEMAKAQFDSVSAQALAGDVAAQEQLKDVVSAFVEESRSYFGANDAYAADFERSTGVIDQVVAQRQAAEDRQVALLEAVEQRLAEIEKRIGQSLDIQEAGFTESVKATRSVVDAQSAAALRARSENA